MKYIIEFDEVPYTPDGSLPYQGERLYRAKGFKSLVFDECGLNKLTPYYVDDQEKKQSYRKGYADGLKHAIETVKKQYARHLMSSAAATTLEKASLTEDETKKV